MTHHHSTRRRWGRLVAAVIVLGGLAAGGALIVRHRSKSTATTATTSVFKTATVESGSLDTTEQIDGSLELSDVTSVLHRIEGQASSSVGTSGSSSGGGAAPSPAVSGAAVSSAAVQSAAAVGCGTGPGSSVPTGSTQPGTTSPGTSVPDTSLPDSTTTSTTPPTTDPGSTQPGTTTPGTTMPGTTTPNGPETTTPCTTGPSGGGGSIGGGLGGSIGGTTGGTGGTGGSTRVTQVVTSVIGQGSKVDIGSVLYSVESSPVVAMGGALPAWRTMNTSSSDGTDIGQLELSLSAMGYDPDHTMTIDTTFDADTKAVVKAWQQGYGMEVTGEVTLGSVVFVSAGATVAGVDVAVGDAIGDGDTVLSLSTSNQQVVIDVPDGAAPYLVPGLAVKVAGADATVSLLRSVERSGSAVVQAVIVPTAPIENASNGATVKVTVAITNLADVLIVPSEALVSRLDGSYAVQVRAADGSNAFVTVELLGVSGTKAGVRGDGLTAGATLLQPA